MNSCSEDCDAVPPGDWFPVSQRNCLHHHGLSSPRRMVLTKDRAVQEQWFSPRVEQSKNNGSHVLLRLLDHEHEGTVLFQKQ